MGKTIRFNENGLIAIKKKLNEIMAGSDDIVSHNDVGGKVKLYHGTTIDALLMIMESGVMSAKRGKQHGETYGVNWFSLKNGDNFNKGVLFSIEVPGDVFNERFRMMNSSEAVSKDDDLDITGFNLTIEKICGLSREAIKNAYDRNVSKGDRYPLESTGYLFYHFIEKVQDDDVLFPSILYHNWDKYYPMIMKNILGDNINESVAKEFAPVTEIGAEPNSPAGGTFHHMEQEQTDEDSLTEGKIPQQFIDNAIKLRPDRYHNWVVIDLVDIGRMPRYFEKKEFAREYYRWLGRGVENSPVLVNLDKLGSLTEGIKFDQHGLSFNDDKILKKYNLKDLILSKTGNYVTLNKIIANELGKGNGSRFMEELTRMADKNGWILALTPDTSFGGSSVGRLKKFYKMFGFVPNKGRSTDFNTRESMIRRPLGENIMGENVEKEVESSEVDLSSFKKRDTLPPGIWKDEETLNSKVRLKLLDIADDFWEFVNLTWVEPKGIIITGSICNFNWSKFSDIDLHLIVDFNEIDEKTEFVKQYLDSKKNEWNTEHEGLKIMGFPVELYVQDIDEMPEAGGIYDLEENAWVRKPNPHTIKNIGLNKFNIKDKAAEIMTIIDDMYDKLSTTSDGHEIDQIGEDAHYLWDKVKDLRKKSLNKNGESGSGNIVYKVLRRTGYLDKLFKLFSTVYDRSNSISESKEILNEFLDSNYGMPLYKYFKWADKASDREKVEDILHKCPWVLDRYLEDMSGHDEELEELYDLICGDIELLYDDEFMKKAIDMLDEKSLLNRILNDIHKYAYPSDLPAWMTMSFIRVVKNEWCIHFTSDAYGIEEKGFTGGTPEIEDLAYTSCGRKKPYAGYDFAFLIDDNSVDFNGYGNTAVIFRASGVLLLHYGDEQRQVVFWGPSVKEFITIWKEQYSDDWNLIGVNGAVLKTGKPSELAHWATENLPQYRKQIVAGKSGYKPWEYSRPAFDNEFMKLPLNNESVKKYLTLLKEEVAMDGSSEDNPYEKRWKAERDALKNFIANYGKLMQSKEDNKGGKLYKVYFDETMSNLIGYNYCICVQWNEQEMKPGSTVYIRALDKFTPFIRRNLQFDTRGRDNMRGTYDDNRFVRESVDELNLYHSSYSNFDKFNHRKYLSSGAGSQTFGWGTYLTDSYPIAKDYAEKFILLKFNKFIVKAEPEKYIENNGSYDEELIKEAAKIYKQIVRFNICMNPERRWVKNSFDSLLKTDEKASENYDNALKEYEQAIQMAKSWAEDVLKKEFDIESFKTNYPKNNILKFSREEYINNINRQNTVYQLVKEMINNIWDDADKHVRKESYIYEVETPDDNGLNYIDLNNEVPNEIIESITSTLSKISRRYGGEWKTMSKWREFLSYCNNAPKGEDIHDELGKLVGVETSIGNYDKAISLFLLQCGIDGFKYKAGTIYGLPDGTDENSTNYVIFDANKVRIVSKNLFTDNF